MAQSTTFISRDKIEQMRCAIWLGKNLIFVDSTSIALYPIGAAQLPGIIVAQVILERLIAAGERLVTDPEVLQEILQRYTAMERREAIGPARATPTWTKSAGPETSLEAAVLIPRWSGTLRALCRILSGRS